MKAVLISTHPKWVEEIAALRKKLELRKSVPNIPVPFKCFIYQTKHKWLFKILRAKKLWALADTLESGFAKVIGEFVCDNIIRNCQMANADLAEQQSRVRRDKIFEYSGGKEVFGWQISDLVIYDEPKALNDFRRPCDNDMYCESCAMHHNNTGACGNAALKIIRPPQSWCYVEEL